MGEMISELYRARLSPNYGKFVETEEFLYHREEYLNLGKQFRAKLDSETLKIFEDYLIHSEKLSYIESEQKFQEGFILGGKIFAEVLTSSHQKNEEVSQ